MPTAHGRGKGRFCISFWVPGVLTNPLNGAHGHWATTAKYRREWRTRTAAAYLSLGLTLTDAERAAPKRVTFMARTWNRMDSDGLQAALKSARDALQGFVYVGDGPEAGTIFCYGQVISRKRRGVQVTVEAL